ncbi:MAG TPA: CBS domain-containing protein [Xanthobacteraceae bacterium]|jgi:predicted transcriptional regulator|nr:CBS domain-containing protein [Xanthobacteraceae bacterium]
MDHPLRRPEEILAYRALDHVLGPKPWDVWSVRPDDSVMAALQIMTDRNIGFVVVLEQDKLVGVLSERDCARRVILARKPVDSTPVSDVMVRLVVTIDLTHKFADCLRLMHQHGFRHLPVMDKGKVVAVVSVRDLMSEAVEHHAKIIAALERERLTVFTSTA